MQALKDINYDGELTLEADHFFGGFPKELYKDCLQLLSRTARYLAEMFIDEPFGKIGSGEADGSVSYKTKVNQKIKEKLV